MGQKSLTCLHESKYLVECEYCNELVCQKCYDKSHGENCALKLMDKILKNEPIRFIMRKEKRIDVFFENSDGYLVKTYRKKKLASGVIKKYGPFWERHRWDSKTKKATFVKYIGKLYSEY